MLWQFQCHIFSLPDSGDDCINFYLGLEDILSDNKFVIIVKKSCWVFMI